ncbi:MAG: hypothetical protein ACPG3T_07220, partial [Pseudomonadales bacterium]
SKLILLKLNNEVKINNEIIKIIIVKKYLLISLKSKFILEKNNLGLGNGTEKASGQAIPIINL